MSQNICALVDLFDKAVAEGARPNTVKRGRNPTRQKYSQPASQIASYIFRHPATIASLWSEAS